MPPGPGIRAGASWLRPGRRLAAGSWGHRRARSRQLVPVSSLRRFGSGPPCLAWPGPGRLVTVNSARRVRHCQRSGRLCGARAGQHQDAGRLRAERPDGRMRAGAQQLSGQRAVCAKVSTLVASAGRCLHRDVAQLGRALDWGSRGRGFKSRRPDQGSPTELPVLYRQNSGGGLFFSMAPACDVGITPTPRCATPSKASTATSKTPPARPSPSPPGAASAASPPSPSSPPCC